MLFEGIYSENVLKCSSNCLEVCRPTEKKSTPKEIVDQRPYGLIFFKLEYSF